MDPSRPAPYLTRVTLDPRRVPDASAWPFTMPWVPGLALEVRHAVTFLVGENGSGKSTLVEGLAEACGLPVAGGGVTELSDGHGPEATSALGRALRPGFRARPHDKWFFRAELSAHLASLLDRRRDDPDFSGDPYRRYGGRSLHTRSHGEAFLELLLERMSSGLVQALFRKCPSRARRDRREAGRTEAEGPGGGFWTR